MLVRAGTGGEYHKYSGSDNVDEVAWYYGNSGNETHPVGQKQPNVFGLFDMSGNVWDRYSNKSSGSLIDPKGPDNGSVRLRRSGGWCDTVMDNRISTRRGSVPASRFNFLGFRLTRSAQ